MKQADLLELDRFTLFLAIVADGVDRATAYEWVYWP